MDFILELIFEFLFIGMCEASQSNRVPKFIRYILIVIILLFFGLLIGFTFIVGIFAFKESIIAGILFIILVLFVIIGIIYVVKEEFSAKNKNTSLNNPDTVYTSLKKYFQK